ncbi:MAG: hypothetical protein KF845_04010 [Cyclobacteriaceae bacterium]|nr:hypothetical protein [Cyclobacteriaceae bacterium]
MKNTFRIFLAVTGITALYGWAEQKQIDKASWLIGTWESKTSRGSLYETWSKVNDSEFYGKSYMLREKDTVVFESIQLVQKQEGLFYMPTVRNQNDGQAVTFKSKLVTDDKLVFENPEHDFPQRIAYTKISQDSLVAEISGVRNGQERAQKFSMKRIK